MLDQEAAFVQIQEAKTMVEEDLQRRLEEFEEEKEQLQKMAASATALEQQLEQASTCVALHGCPRCVHCAGCVSSPLQCHIIGPGGFHRPAVHLLPQVFLYARPLHVGGCCSVCARTPKPEQ